MRAFTLKLFRDAGWTISNIELTKYTIENTGSVVSIFYKPDEDSEPIPVAQCQKNIYWLDADIPMSLEKQEELGINFNNQDGRQSRDGMFARIIDSIYYQANPIKPASKTGKVYAKTFNNLRSRLDSPKYRNAPVTKKLINIVIKYLQESFEREGIAPLPDNPVYREAMSRKLFQTFGGYLYCCYLTGIIDTADSLSRVVLSGVVRTINRNVNPRDFGYTRDDSTGDFIKEGEYVFNNQVFLLAEGQTTCPCCRREVPTALIDPDENICKPCIEDRYKIHNYTTRVPTLLSFKAKKVTPKTIYLGCELEYETTNRDEARIKVGKLLQGHAIMKSDGSIRNGFEIVTCPATLDIHLEEFKNFFNKRPEELKTASNVGMHVHVSRKPLNFFTVGKITEFMNKDSNKKFIEFIAGRKPNSYCNLDTRRTITYPFTAQGYSERYNTVNLCNADTIEFRIFSTPMTYEEFAAKLQFCQAVVDYCQPAQVPIPLKDLTNYQSFINWLMPQRKVYPELVSIMKGFA